MQHRRSHSKSVERQVMRYSARPRDWFSDGVYGVCAERQNSEVHGVMVQNDEMIAHAGCRLEGVPVTGMIPQRVDRILVNGKINPKCHQHTS